MSKTVLEKARALISNPKKWTRAAMARGVDGREVLPNSRAAKCFCSLGALKRVAEDFSPPYALRWAARSLDDRFNCAVFEFNDSHTHDEVLWMFDLAIAMEAVGE